VKVTVEFDSLEELQEVENKLVRLENAVDDLWQINEQVQKIVEGQLKSKSRARGSQAKSS
jgi:hypothetical protein